MTEKGTCDRAYRYPVRISGGSVGYAGEASFNVTGRVGANGAVTVTVSRGSQSATGSGMLSASDGSGTLAHRFRRMLGHLDRRAPRLRIYCPTTLFCLRPPNLKPGASRAFFRSDDGFVEADGF